MKVLLIHNRYRQPGGEDAVVRSEAQLLRSQGVRVREALFGNDVGPASPLRGAIRIAVGSVWSRQSYAYCIKLCEDYRPDIIHVHNFWMRVSPSVHAAARACAVPTVQTLHNFRLLCTNALLYRDGKPCEDCVGKTPWRGVARRCYRQSLGASAGAAAMAVFNRSRGTWDKDVDALVTLSENSRQKFIAGGLPADRLFVKPNFVADPGPCKPAAVSKMILFAGRLSPEKGADVLLSAWSRSQAGRYGRLILAGDGPERPRLEHMTASLGLTSTVEFVGYRTPPELEQIIANCRAVVVPSLCYENFPRIVVESFACGKPAIGSDIGALGEIIRSGAGIRVGPGDSAGLGNALTTVLSDDRLADALGEAARAEYLTRYTPERNFEQLMTIYQFASGRRSQAGAVEQRQEAAAGPVCGSRV